MLIKPIGFVFVLNYHSSLFCFIVVNTGLIICVSLTIYEWLSARKYNHKKYDYYHCLLLEDYQEQFAIIYYAIWIVIIVMAFALFIVALIISHFGYRNNAAKIDKNSQNNEAQNSVAIIGDNTVNGYDGDHINDNLPTKLQTQTQVQLSVQSNTVIVPLYK